MGEPWKVPEAKQSEQLIDAAQNSWLERQEQASPPYGFGGAPEGPRGQSLHLPWGWGQARKKNRPTPTAPTIKLGVHYPGGTQDFSKLYTLRQARPGRKEDTQVPERGLLIHTLPIALSMPQKATPQPPPRIFAESAPKWKPATGFSTGAWPSLSPSRERLWLLQLLETPALYTSPTEGSRPGWKGRG